MQTVNEHWLIFQDEQILLCEDNSIPLTADIQPLHFIRKHLIIEFDNKKIYCAEMHVDIVIPPTLKSILFKKALSLISHDWYGIAAKAYAIINWDKTNQFCGRCGEKTKHKTGTVERVCLACGLAFYPRISPSVIVLIQKGDEILMARSPHFAPGAYGLIAGFVEAGESIEQAVHREVKEEVNINIKDLRYFGSQSWPFPDSLMIGFFANYADGDLILNPDEIEDGGWYTHDKLPGFPSTSVSIGTKMIRHWLDCIKNK